jgi:putative nucleotidyltransferase with HDIG domain
MTGEALKQRGFTYQVIVTVIGISLWLMAVLYLGITYAVKEFSMFLALIPIIIVMGMFIQHFQMPLGLKFTKERMTFTLADSIVLLIACWFGLAAAVCFAGIEGFTSSRRTTRRLSSNLFSSAIMSIGAAVTSLTFHWVMQNQLSDQTGSLSARAMLTVGIAIFIASIVQIACNIILLSTLLALRHNKPIYQHWKHFLWAVPMFLPNSAVATLLFYGVQYHLLLTLFVAVPLFFAIYFGHRQSQDSVKKRIAVMEKAHRETIEALAVAINAKDEVTHEHVLRVQIYAACVARILGCSDAEIEALKAGALLHDIGKIAVPDYILNKPGKLTATEFEKMKLHTIAGARILSRVEFPYPIVPVVRHHHERWDGKGYPDGLKGEEIPLTARILSVVDCFDAVREDRQYRKGMTRQEAINLVLQGSGTQYDPRVVNHFIGNLAEFEAEIQAHRNMPVPTYGIEPNEELSESARAVLPAAGLADSEGDKKQDLIRLTYSQLTAVCELARSLMKAKNQNELLSIFTEKLQSIVSYELCSITLIEPTKGYNWVAHASGKYSLFLKERRILPEEGVTGWVLSNRSSLFNTDPNLDLPDSLIKECPEFRTLAVCPILKEEEIYGAVSLYSTNLVEYSQEHQNLLKETVALLASVLSTFSVKDLAKNPLATSEIVQSSPSTHIFDSEADVLAVTVTKSELTH